MDCRNKLYLCAEQNKIDIDWFSLDEVEALSLSIEDTYAIALDPRRIQSIADETVKLAHELGHCVYGGFYDKKCPLNIRERHEYRANAWAFKKVTPFQKLREYIVNGFQLYEMAEELCVTEEFIENALTYYTERKGYKFE